MESKERLRAEENVCMMFNRFLSLCNAEQEEHKTLILNMKQAFLEIAPVDAAEVVRCKDCDWYRPHEDGICVNPHCTKSFYGCRVRTDHFCSYGERREGE